jgi:hypothetical protein
MGRYGRGLAQVAASAWSLRPWAERPAQRYARDFLFSIYFQIDFEKPSDQFLGLIVMSH